MTAFSQIISFSVRYTENDECNDRDDEQVSQNTCNKSIRQMV